MKLRYVDIHTHHPRPEVLSPTMSGIHPWDAERGLPLPSFEECDIIGETGLDFACKANRQAQIELFEGHLSEAERIAKPVVLHVVRSFEEIMRQLRQHDIQGVVFHGFVGSIEQAERCRERGYYLSFGVRSLRSSKTRQVIERYPIQLLFCETDDSEQPSIEQIYDEVARLRNTSIEELQQRVMTNYNRLFKQDD